MKEKPLFIGIDIGTSRAKGVMFNERGISVAQASVIYKHVKTTYDSVEQDANEWWHASRQIIKHLSGQAPEGTMIRSLAFSTQGGSLVATDADGQPICQAIIWQDQRGSSWRDTVINQIGADAVYDKSGWNLGNGLNLLQIMRLRATQQDLFRRSRLFLSVADFLSLRLTGIAAVDCSNGGINQLMNIHEMKWDDSLLSLAGIRSEQLATVVSSGQVIGRLLPEVAADLDLAPDTVVVSGGHDQYCAALGAGAVHDGDRLVGTGTAWVLVEICRNPNNNQLVKKALSRHVVDGLWGRLMSLPTAGTSLEWFIKTYHPEGQMSRTSIDLSELDRLVKNRLPNSTRPYFYPYFTGSSYPKKIDKANAVFSQLAMDHDWIDMAAAIMEGVAMQASWMWEAFSGQPSKEPILMTGGASHSHVWRQLFANVLDRDIAIPQTKEVGCLGAAMLAASGSGYFPDPISACIKMSQHREIVTPDELRPLTLERYAKYKKIHESMFR